jgi:hypothetical protein
MLQPFTGQCMVTCPYESKVLERCIQSINLLVVFTVLALRANACCDIESPILAYLRWKLKWVFDRPLSVSLLRVLNFRLLLQNHLAHFNQTSHKSFVSKWNSKLFKWMAMSPGENTMNFSKTQLDKFNKAWHKSLFGEGNSTLFR